ncbi:MAG: hypothetical protein F9K29_03300 [Hyphomicrobiaceae bacterium]|nr:MAG: hypothetical protein F9K29_03300 [Hyphomicrobiaceae bacterium]
MLSKMQHIEDDELERLAAEAGPDSLEAKTLDDLRRERAQDRQAFAFRIGEFYLVGPMPDAETDLTMSLAYEYVKRMRSPM